MLRNDEAIAQNTVTIEGTAHPAFYHPYTSATAAPRRDL